MAKVENPNKLKISDEVIAKIVNVAISETTGVSANKGEAIVGKLAKKSSAKGVKIEFGEDSVSITASISVEYGYNLQDVGKNVQENVWHAVENMTGLKVQAVNVTVSGITFAEKKEK